VLFFACLKLEKAIESEGARDPREAGANRSDQSIGCGGLGRDRRASREERAAQRAGALDEGEAPLGESACAEDQGLIAS
jgi:hypothetical protein